MGAPPYLFRTTSTEGALACMLSFDGADAPDLGRPTHSDSRCRLSVKITPYFLSPRLCVECRRNRTVRRLTRASRSAATGFRTSMNRGQWTSEYSARGKLYSQCRKTPRGARTLRTKNALRTRFQGPVARGRRNRSKDAYRRKSSDVLPELTGGYASHERVAEALRQVNQSCAPVVNPVARMAPEFQLFSLPTCLALTLKPLQDQIASERTARTRAKSSSSECPFSATFTFTVVHPG